MRALRAETLVTLAVFAACAALLLWGTGAGSVVNGDEATYALFARAMRETGDVFHLRLGGAILHQRPPLYVWLLAASTGALGEGMFALRLPSVLAGAGTAAILWRLGRRLGFSPVAALAGALLLPTLGLWFLYARAVVSDVPLCFFVVLAIDAWLAERWTLAGAALGAALMTKQVVGLLPLLAPFALVLARGRAGLPPGRAFARAALAFAVVWLPWHALMLAWHGRAWLDGYLGFNVVSRATSSVLPPTGIQYYLEVVWTKEGVCALLFALGAIVAALRLRRQAPGHALLLLWALGVLAVFTLASSRIDYYLLPAYPALALLAAEPIDLVALRSLPAAAVLAALVISGSAALHLPQRLGDVDRSHEIRELCAAVPPGAPLVVIDDLPFAPELYARRPVTLVVTRRANFERLQGIELFSAPGNMVHVEPDDLPDWLAARGRYVALEPVAQVRHRPPPGAHILAQTPQYVLYGSP